MKGGSLAIIVALCLVGTAVSDERVRVLLPKALKDQFPPNGELTVRPAMFGIPSYAQTITGTVVWVTANGRDGCQPIDKSKLPWPDKGSVITLVDRGNCSFVQKVRNTEMAGGIAAIVVNNDDADYLPYMADDGTGRSIGIPSVIIFKKDGAKIKQVLSQPEVVQISMTWSLPAPDNRVEIEYWTSAVDDDSKEFKRSFGPVAKALGNHAEFDFRYYIIDGYAYGCTRDSQPCGNQCVNKGLYCASDPDHDVSKGLSGADVVIENLRQICLARYLNATEQSYKWFTYVNRFTDECSGSKESWTEKCSFDIMLELGVSLSDIRKCIVDSGGIQDALTYNSLLEKELARIYEIGVFFLPSLYVNLVPYRGALVCPNPSDISRCGPLQMICQGYLDGTEPTACFSDPQCPVGQRLDACGVCGGDGSVDKCGRCLSAKDPTRVDNGGIDACGKCLPFADPQFNKTCLGCDGVVNSGKTLDRCRRCKSPDDPSRDQGCEADTSGSNIGAVIGILVLGAIIVGVGVWYYMKKREARLRGDIDSLLRQYLPLDASGELGNAPVSDTHSLVSVQPSDRMRAGAPMDE